MKKLFNVLYVTSEKAYISAENSNIVVIVDDEQKFKVPIHILENIICFSYVGASPSAIKLCGENNVSINFISPNGKYLGCFIGKRYGSIHVRKEQYRLTLHEEKSLEIAKLIIMAKSINQKNILERYIRDNNRSDLIVVKNNINTLIKSIDNAKDYKELLGIEGNIAKEYFNVFDNFIKQQKDDFKFTERSKRPPMDMTNALLSFFYTILTNEYLSAIESVGLDSYAGIYHKDRSGRASLACDLMEELRAPMVDRFVLNLINNKIITKRDFMLDISDIPTLKDDSRKRILQLWQEKKKEFITHPFLEEKIEVGLIPYTQALLFSRYIRKELEVYPPFIWR